MRRLPRSGKKIVKVDKLLTSDQNAKGRGPSSTKGHILIVEDDPFFTKVLRIILTGEDFEVSSAATLGEARVLLGGLTFDVIISDLRMPDGDDGLLLLEELRRKGNPVPFIMLTGYGEVDNYMVAMNAGASDYLNKPVKAEELIAVIENCLHPRKPKA
jgi:two-component system, NtrC family, response regulator HydG